MDIENSRMLGTAVITLTSLLGSYYLILRIREHHEEHPDPKLTYVTHTQLDKMRAEMMETVGEAVRDLRALRAEIRDETRSLQKEYLRSLSETRELVSKNAQNISALVAQSQTYAQRIAELAVKTDRIAMRAKGGE